MRRWLSFFALTAAFALATWISWWGVLIVALLWGALQPRVNAPAGTAAAAAGLAWALWFGYDRVVAGGNFTALAGRLAGVFTLPVPALLLVTAMFAALLAWSAAAIGGAVAGIMAPASPLAHPPEDAPPHGGSRGAGTRPAH
jgi:hypothetical protein